MPSSSPKLQRLELVMVLPKGFLPANVWRSPSDAQNPAWFRVQDNLGRCPDAAAFLCRMPRAACPQPITATNHGLTSSVVPEDSREMTHLPVLAVININGGRSSAQVGTGHIEASVSSQHNTRFSLFTRGSFEQVIHLFLAPKAITFLRLCSPKASAEPLRALPTFHDPAWLTFVTQRRNVQKLDNHSDYQILRSLAFPPQKTSIHPTPTDADADSILPSLQILRFCDCHIPEAHAFQRDLQALLSQARATAFTGIELAECYGVSEGLVRSLRDGTHLERMGR